MEYSEFGVPLDNETMIVTIPTIILATNGDE